MNNNSKAFLDAHLPSFVPIEHSNTLNIDRVDPNIYDSLRVSAWDEDTCYPVYDPESRRSLGREAWIGANTPDRVKPSLGQCFVTAKLLERFYPGSGSLLVDIDDPQFPVLIPHYFFWKNTGANNVAEFRNEAHNLVQELVTGSLTLDQSPLIDLTGDQFSPGSIIRFIDPLSDKYANDVIEHLDSDQTFPFRFIRLLQRFDEAVCDKTGMEVFGFRQSLNPNLPEKSPFVPGTDNSTISRILD